MIGGVSWTVAVADTPWERAQGLMGITDLGTVDGMLFSWEQDVAAAFWMKDTPIPLDIAFFTDAGVLIEVIEMVPCEVDPCPRYAPGAAYRYAVEADPGRFAAGDNLILSP